MPITFRDIQGFLTPPTPIHYGPDATESVARMGNMRENARSNQANEKYRQDALAAEQEAAATERKRADDADISRLQGEYAQAVARGDDAAAEAAKLALARYGVTVTDEYDAETSATEKPVEQKSALDAETNAQLDEIAPPAPSDQEILDAGKPDEVTAAPEPADPAAEDAAYAKRSATAYSDVVGAEVKGEAIPDGNLGVTAPEAERKAQGISRDRALGVPPPSDLPDTEVQEEGPPLVGQSQRRPSESLQMYMQRVRGGMNGAQNAFYRHEDYWAGERGDPNSHDYATGKMYDENGVLSGVDALNRNPDSTPQYKLLGGGDDASPRAPLPGPSPQAPLAAPPAPQRTPRGIRFMRDGQPMGDAVPVYEIRRESFEQEIANANSMADALDATGDPGITKYSGFLRAAAAQAAALMRAGKSPAAPLKDAKDLIKTFVGLDMKIIGANAATGLGYNRGENTDRIRVYNDAVHRAQNDAEKAGAKPVRDRINDFETAIEHIKSGDAMGASVAFELLVKRLTGATATEAQMDRLLNIEGMKTRLEQIMNYYSGKSKLKDGETIQQLEAQFDRDLSKLREYSINNAVRAVRNVYSNSLVKSYAGKDIDSIANDVASLHGYSLDELRPFMEPSEPAPQPKGTQKRKPKGGDDKQPATTKPAPAKTYTKEELIGIFGGGQ